MACRKDRVRKIKNHHVNQSHHYLVYKDRETEPPLINMQDTSQHVQRRKPWNRAFNSDSLKGYESILVRRSRELVEAFSKRQSEAVDMARWMEYFA